jgi:group I intron endonuclease
MQGIYKIENIINKKVYIGSSENISRRLTSHIYLLNKNSHHSTPLQKAWNKYGKEAFTFTILEICKENILEKEQLYLDTILQAQEYISGDNKNFLKLGYNIKPTAANNKGFKFSTETILKMLNSKNTEHVLSINLIDGEILEFVSTGYAAKHFNVNVNVVRNSIKRKATSRKLIDIGFIYKKDYYQEFKPKKYSPWNKNVKTNANALNAKKVFVKNLINNEIKTFNSVKECANYYNTTSPFIIKRLRKGYNLNFDRKGSALYKLRMFYDINEM